MMTSQAKDSGSNDVAEGEGEAVSVSGTDDLGARDMNAATRPVSSQQAPETTCTGDGTGGGGAVTVLPVENANLIHAFHGLDVRQVVTRQELTLLREM